MSYLDVPRAHFVGVFAARPSTANNQQQSYVSAQDGIASPASPANWNPSGDHFWGVQAQIVSFVDQDGRVIEADSGDLLVRSSLVSSAEMSSAKLVDLDVDQQVRSRLYGLQIRIMPARGGSPLLEGRFLDSADLRRIWFRRPNTGPSAVWQSVLEDLNWGNTGSSLLLQQLRETSPERLSVRFTVYGYDSPTKQGRLIGALGPAFDNEPRHDIASRLLVPTEQGQLWVCPAKVDEGAGTLTVDLSNSLPMASGGISPMDMGEMHAAILKPEGTILLGKIDYLQDYLRTSGITRIELSAQHMGLLSTNPLHLVTVSPESELKAGGLLESELAENGDGIHVMVDRATLRLIPGDQAAVDVFVTEFGKAKPNHTLTLDFVTNVSGGSTINNEPRGALSFPNTLTTDQNGQAQIALTAHDPTGKPPRRIPVGGQLYFIGGSWASFDPSSVAPLTVRVFDEMQDVPEPTWEDIRPILLPYSALCPFMKNIVDLSDYDQVKATRTAIARVIAVDESDAMHMPVSRDLSRKQRDLILLWIELGCPRGVAVAGTA